jgi:hypothetical protein
VKRSHNQHNLQSIITVPTLITPNQTSLLETCFKAVIKHLNDASDTVQLKSLNPHLKVWHTNLHSTLDTQTTSIACWCTFQVMLHEYMEKNRCVSDMSLNGLACDLMHTITLYRCVKVPCVLRGVEQYKRCAPFIIVQQVTDAGLAVLAQNCPQLRSLQVSGMCTNSSYTSMNRYYFLVPKNSIWETHTVIQFRFSVECTQCTASGVITVLKQCRKITQLNLAWMEHFTDNDIAQILPHAPQVTALTLKG